VKLLPDTDERLLRVAVIGMAMGCVWFTVIGLRLAFSGDPSHGVLPLMLSPPLAVGLWRLWRWARILALAVLWLLMFFVGGPFGELSVIAAINGDAPPLPIVQQLIYRIVPFVVPSAFFIEVLCAYGPEFKWRRSAEGDTGSSQRPSLPRSWLLWCWAILATPALMVLVLNFAKDLNGGCIPFPPPVHGGHWKYEEIWHIPALICAFVGLLAFIAAAPAKARKMNLGVRALIYGAGILAFHGEVFSYTQYAEMCHLH
jgi:hypothetical protein